MTTLKQRLGKKLTKKQYTFLSTMRRRTLPNIRYKLGQSPFLMLGLVVKLLPASSQVTVKSGINIVKKMDYKSKAIYLSVDSDFEYRVRLRTCRKEPDTVEWIETFLKEGDVLYDIGANNGTISLLASKIHDDKVRVYAFEPAFLNYTQLCKNLILNGCQDNIVPIPIALSDETTLNSFNFYNLIPGGAIHALGEAVDVGGRVFKPVSTQPVLSFRLDDFVAQFKIPPPDHIKMDVDGTEFTVIKGMSETLEGGALRSLMFELNAGRGLVPQMIEYLSGKGFEVRSKLGVNHLFVRKS